MNHKRSTAPPSVPHVIAMQRLRSLGWEPRTIYDVGAYHGHWSTAIASVFPQAGYVLFEANADNEPELQKAGHRYFIATLANEDGVERQFFTPKAVVATGASLYRENTVFYSDENMVVRKTVTVRLDTLVAAHKLPPADLIKIDVQGAELDVLAGATVGIASCQALILETSFLNYNRGAPLFGDVVAAAGQIGFKCVDVCEALRLGKGIMTQMDLLFVRGDLYERYYRAAGLGG